MKLVNSAIAGTLESGDVMIELNPGENGVEIDLQSTVESQFGKYIRSVIVDTCREFELENVKVRVQDKGALDCTIKARMTTAILRSSNGEIKYEF